MKIDLYVDIYPGMSKTCIMAVANPTQKIKGNKRYKITANIPDEAFYGDLDGQAPVEEIVEVDKDVD